MIELSQAARSEIRRLKSKQLPSNIFVRLAVKPGGCSGWLLIDAASLNYINGLIVDYSEDLMGGGFRFHNKSAIATCGCGNSFSTSQYIVVSG
jgi:iron-sulfur cluster assembly protein